MRTYEFKIMDVIRKWWVVVMVVSLLGAVVFNAYLSGQQTYTARTMIGYISDSATQGLTPAGSPIDVTEITSSNVIQEALTSLGISPGLEKVRSAITVTPVIPEDELTRKEAILEDGLEYEYYPTQYIVSFVADSEEGADYARRVLDAVLDSYFRYYCQKYVNMEVYPNSSDNALRAVFDYIESVEIIDSSLLSMLTYLHACAEAYPNYRSSHTGYNFNGLLQLYQNLYDVNMYFLYAQVLDNALTRDGEILQNKYAMRMQNNQRDIDSNQERAEAVQRTMQTYVNKHAQSQQRYIQAASNEDNVNNNMVIDFVSRQDAQSTDTTYDQLVYQYVDYQISIRTSEIANAFNAYVMECFAKNSERNTPQAQQAFMAQLEEVVGQSEELYAILVETVSEFNDYLAVQNVVTQSSIQVVNGINIKLYLLLVFFLFVIVGTVGAVMLGYFSNLVHRMMYVDKTTGLPNKASWDMAVTDAARKPLPHDTCVCVISLNNLVETNERDGREFGDLMLKNVGIILQDLAKDYGMLAYTGGSMFSGLFTQCSLDKAKLFSNSFLEAVARYNRQFPENAIQAQCVLREAGEAGAYDVRTLLGGAIRELQESIRRENHEAKAEKAAKGEKTK